MSDKQDQNNRQGRESIYGSHNACHEIVGRIKVKAGALDVSGSVIKQVSRTKNLYGSGVAAEMTPFSTVDEVIPVFIA